MANLKPIETYYNGYRFRSRLEARWAVFFDALGVEYEYEPEGFELPSGKRYLPDFKVKCYGTRGNRHKSDYFDLYIEVKGKMTQRDAERIKEFAGEAVAGKDKFGNSYSWWEIRNPTLIVGKIPSIGKEFEFDGMPMDGIDVYQFNYDLIDGDYFGAYPAAHDGKFYLMGDDSNYINDDDIPAVLEAYKKARQARFEYGDIPNI